MRTIWRCYAPAATSRLERSLLKPSIRALQRSLPSQPLAFNGFDEQDIRPLDAVHEVVGVVLFDTGVVKLGAELVNQTAGSLAPEFHAAASVYFVAGAPKVVVTEPAEVGVSKRAGV
jgi:hypothetical protein